MAEDCSGRQLDEMVKWVVTANENDLWVSTGPTWDAEHDAEALANARLIAAAPELLDALGAVDDAADSMYFDPDSRFGEALAKVRAAWAKATVAPA